MIGAHAVYFQLGYKYSSLFWPGELTYSILPTCPLLPVSVFTRMPPGMPPPLPTPISSITGP